MQGHTISLVGPSSRDHAKRLVDAAPHGAVLNIRKRKRTVEQNDRMWAMLSELNVHMSKKYNRVATPETWKCRFMDALKIECHVTENLEGTGVIAMGYHSSKLTVEQMTALIELIFEFGARHEMIWTDDVKVAA